MPSALSSHLARVRSWYARIERPISSLSLVGGFVFDAVTLRRVDAFWENFWVIVHLLIVATCIILINRQENVAASPTGPATAAGDVPVAGDAALSAFDAAKDPARLHFWLVNALQFFFGGLLSTYIVFYFRSAVLTVTWPFLLILAIAFVANESLKRHYARLSFQVAFFFLSVYAFAIFIVPVELHRIGKAAFVVSGLASLAVLAVFLILVRAFAGNRFSGHRLLLYSSIVAIFAAVNLLYFYHLIPPLPLSLKDAGIYHSVERNPDGNYDVLDEDGSASDSPLSVSIIQSIRSFFQTSQTVHIMPGDPVYAYTAIFSPPNLDLSIIHEWQHYLPSENDWVTFDSISLPVVGGRDGGYRTYSVETSPAAGQWRVNVKTSDGQLIGRIDFSVVVQDAEPALASETHY